MTVTSGAPVMWREPLWQLSFPVPDAPAAALAIGDAVSVEYADGRVEASVRFTGRAPLRLGCTASAGTRVSLANYGHRLTLAADGVLADEDWPIGEASLDGAVCAVCPPETALTAPGTPPEPARPPFEGIQGWKPSGANVHAGDCMPFVHEGVFHLFYLFDRRGHHSKWGLGAHQWGHVSSRDLLHWEQYPLAVAIENQAEGSICTGSTVFAEGRYHAYYAQRMCDGSPALLTRSVSDDGIRFTKTGERLTLPAPYDAAAARDPKVFRGEDGAFHMLVTTAYKGKGCLAHLVSSALDEWTLRDPMVQLGIADQPECSDSFRFGDWYYLVYSNYGVAHYFVSRSQFGPWTATADNVVVGETLRVPKAAVWNGRLLFAGFRIDPDVQWAGTVWLYEAAQNADGSLRFTLYDPTEVSL